MTTLLLAATLAAAPAPRLGADVTVSAPTVGTVVAVVGTVRIEAEVEGDVVALLGDVELAPGARVSGDVVALGGRVIGTGSTSGRIVSVATFAGIGPGLLAAGGTGRASLAVACMRLGGWLVLVSLLAIFLPQHLRLTAAELTSRPGRTVLVGAVSLVVWVGVAGLALAFARSPVGAVGVLLAIGAFLLAKVLGVAGLAWLVGRRLAPVLPVVLRGESARTGVAVLLLGLASCVPLAGETLWAAANVAGLGAVAAAWVRPRTLLVGAAEALVRPGSLT